MAFTKVELEQHRKIVDAFIERRRPPMELRNQLDLSFRITNQSIEIFEIRPRFDDPQSRFEIPVAKATWVKSQKVWRVYWRRADLKWHRYPPLPEVSSLPEFVDAVEADEHHCFFG